MKIATIKAFQMMIDIFDAEGKPVNYIICKKKLTYYSMLQQISVN